VHLPRGLIKASVCVRARLARQACWAGAHGVNAARWTSERAGGCAIAGRLAPPRNDCA